MANSLRDIISQNSKILKSKASKPSLQAVGIAVAAVIIATLLVCYTENQTITIQGIIQAQSNNSMLWVLDVLPFIFGYIGQYTSYILSQEANLMVLEQTEELRQHASKLEEEARFTATHDILTGLPNRALFHDRLEQTLRHPRADKRGFSVLIIAIENLKEIQDTLGLTTTDLCVKQLSTRLTSWAESIDSFARIEAYSFAILLSECDERSKAEHAARNLIKAIEPHFIVNSLKLTLHPSIGIAMFPDHGEDADTLLQRSGVAQFFASKSFNGFSIYSPSMDEHSPRRLTLMGELKRALDRSELDLYFQPKIDISKNTVVGVEALIRWNHKLHGDVPPEEFIMLAEQHRIIHPLSQWVLEQAFTYCAAWHSAGIALKVSINLSTKDLLDPELPDQIAGISARTSVDPEWIVFEITESSIMGDPARALVIIERLRSMGYQLSIDDFGTGYSSMAYLKKLPVSELKIDKSFVMDMTANESDAIIVRAIVDLAHNLGLSVTAEGVENTKTIEMLKSMHCDIAQGYFYSKPLPKSELDKWLSDWSVVPTLKAN